MGFWLTFFLWVGSFLLTDYFRAKLPNQEPSGEGDFQSPTSTEGRKVPQVVGGTVKIKGPNTLWRGDWEAIPVQVETGVVFKRDETVGYQYNIALALGQFIGRTAGMTAIYIGDDKVWDYVDDNGSVPALVADVDLPELWGGETKGGGFVGRFRAFDGNNNQAVSSYLSSRVTNQSAWPGTVYVMLTNLTETAGANIGEANQLRDIRIEWQCHDTIANGGLGNELSLTGDQHIIGRDANPISCAYRLLTDPDWAVSLGDIDFTSFQTAAATCYTEGIGYSQVVDSETEAFEILAEIEKHIDGYIGPNPTTGLVEVTLARADYDPVTEFQATEDNILAINDFAKPEWPQTKNEVKVRFVNREKDYTDDHAVAQDMAGRLISGRPQSVTIRYPGLRDAAAANKIVARTARTYFWPLAKFQLEIDRTGWNLRPGSVVVVTHPDIGATNLATRVTKISVGDPVKQTIKVDVVEDVFADEIGIQAQPQPSGDVAPSATPVALTNSIQTHAPRWLLDKEGQALEPRLLWLVERDIPNSGYTIEYRTRGTYTSGNFGAQIFDAAVPTFTTMGTLRANLGMLQDTVNDGNATAGEGGEFDVDGNVQSVVGSYNPYDYVGLAVINPGGTNEEFVAMKTIALDGAGVKCSNVIRGIGNSPISTHTAGEPVAFLDRGAYLQEWLRTDGDINFGAQFKTAPIAQGVTGTLSAYGGEKQIDDRGYRKPYPPTGVFFTNISSSVWYPNGDAEASGPGTNLFIPAGGIPITVWNRRFDTQNQVFGANSRDDNGTIYTTNSFLDVTPTLNWFVYDLNTHPNPVRGNELLSGTVASNSLSAAFTIAKDDVEALEASNPSPINARFEFTWENGVELDGVAVGVESNSVFFDKQITYLPPQYSYSAFEDTILLLHFEGFDRTTQVIDYSQYDHPVTLVSDAEIDTDIAPDTGLAAGSLIIDGTGDWAEIPDHAAFTIGADTGFTIQARIYLKSGISGEMPIVTKWDATGNQRSFWFGFNGNALRLKMSVDGTAELIESTGTRTWNTGQWYEIAVSVFNQGGTTYCFFFVDGVFDETESLTAITTLFDSTAPVRIGADANGNSAQAMNIDEVRIAASTLYLSTFTLLQQEYPGRERQKTLHVNWEKHADGDVANLTTDDLNRMPITVPGGVNVTTEVDDAQSKFGTKSLFCGGRNATDANDTDGVWLPNTGADGYATTDPGTYEHITDFGTRDFTVEGFVRFATIPSLLSGDGTALVTKYWRGYVGTSPWGDFFLEINKSDQLYFTYDGGKEGFGTYATGNASLGSLSTGVWYHFALVRENGNISLFWEGNRVLFDDSGAGAIAMNNGGGAWLALGRRRSTSSGTTRHRALHGWLDEIRITNGTAHYSGATYTVPTAAFPVDPLPEAQPPPAAVPLTSNWAPTNL